MRETLSRFRAPLQEIPTMDVSKSTVTLGSQILGNTMEGLYRLDKIISRSSCSRI
ncbi:hypothetical protein ACT7CZ_09445 [Bacillus cereus]